MIFKLFYKQFFCCINDLKNRKNDILNYIIDLKIVMNMMYEDFLNDIYCSIDNLKML